MNEPRTVKVTKCAERKVNLEGISSRYDNISWGTIISHEFEYETEEELLKKMQEISNLAVIQTEKDIRNNLIMLKVMEEDKDNDCLLGNGPNLEYTEQEVNNMKVLISKTRSVEESKPQKENKKTEDKKEEIETKTETKTETKKEEDFLDIDDDDILFGGAESVEDVLEEETTNVTNAEDEDLFGDDDDEDSLLSDTDGDSGGIFDDMSNSDENEKNKEKPKETDSSEEKEDFDIADYTGGLLDD